MPSRRASPPMQGFDLGPVDAARWPEVTAALVASGGPASAVARLDGGVLALGRYQAASRTLSAEGATKPRVRRATGGRAIALGGGQVAVAVVWPSLGWLADEGSTSLAAGLVLNRGVRGLLGALASLGVPAHYPGRDFLAAAGGQAGFLGFDVTRDGRVLLECVLATRTHWWPDDAWFALPPRAPRRGVPGPSMLPEAAGTDTASWLRALQHGFRERLGTDVVPSTRPPPGTADLGASVRPGEPPEVEAFDGPTETPAGFLDVGTTVREGRFHDVWFGGELLMTSGAHATLRGALRGTAVSVDAVTGVVERIFADPSNAVPGLDDLGLLARAVVAAGTAR